MHAAPQPAVSPDSQLELWRLNTPDHDPMTMPLPASLTMLPATNSKLLSTGTLPMGQDYLLLVDSQIHRDFSHQGELRELVDTCQVLINITNGQQDETIVAITAAT